MKLPEYLFCNLIQCASYFGFNLWELFFFISFRIRLMNMMI